MWAALLLRESAPELSIHIIEQKLCGHGASGCNGGCLLTLSPKHLTLKKFYGEQEARRLVQASEQSVVDNICQVQSLHATALHLPGMDHQRLSYDHSPIERGVTDIHGHVIRDTLACPDLLFDWR